MRSNKNSVLVPFFPVIRIRIGPETCHLLGVPRVSRARPRPEPKAAESPRGGRARNHRSGHFAAKRADDVAEAARVRVCSGPWPVHRNARGGFGPAGKCMRGAWHFFRFKVNEALFRFTVRPPLVTALVTGIHGRGGLDAAFAATGPLAGAVILVGSSVCLDFDVVVFFFGSRLIGQNWDHRRRLPVFRWIVTCLYPLSRPG